MTYKKFISINYKYNNMEVSFHAIQRHTLAVPIVGHEGWRIEHDMEHER
ncbi:MAG: hypothetical protein XD62_1312 [Methanosarcinales archeaon 56_1174]|nr:MAG: hypothetical protein XD62_1312 [Methanosarcinales archeaon 56_1174]